MATNNMNCTTCSGGSGHCRGWQWTLSGAVAGRPSFAATAAGRQILTEAIERLRSYRLEALCICWGNPAVKSSEVWCVHACRSCHELYCWACAERSMATFMATLADVADTRLKDRPTAYPDSHWVWICRRTDRLRGQVHLHPHIRPRPLLSYLRGPPPRRQKLPILHALHGTLPTRWQEG